MKHLTILRRESQWWSDVSVQIARGVLVRMDRAFQDFFRRVKKGEKPGYPRFQGQGRFQCIEMAEVAPGMVKGNKIHVKGMPAVRIRPDRELPDSRQLKSMRFVMHGRQLWVNLVYEEEIEPLPLSHKEVGIDLGVNQRLTLSDGSVVERRKLDRSRENRLRRKVSRAQEDSNGRRKAVAALARETRRNEIRNRNECHRITTELVRQFGVIVVEKLNMKGMTAAGGRWKQGLNREILAQTWGLIKQQLTYKAEWAGRRFVEVSAAYTSRTCAECQHVNAKSRIYRVFECAKCGHVADRDMNASRNILARGALAPVA